MSDQREQLNEMKQFMAIAEGKERPYVCHHPKKGEHECSADSSYGAAKKAAHAWGLNSTADISATLTDITHSTQFVGEDEYDDEDDGDEHYNMKDAEVEEFEGRTVYVTDLYDGDIYGMLDSNRFMLSAPIDRGYGVGNISDDEIEIFDADFSLTPDDEDFLRRWYLEDDADEEGEWVDEGLSDPDDTDWDAHWAREDGDEERADDLEADAEFARMDDELSETGWGNVAGGDDEDDEDHHEIKDRHEERPHTSGYNKLGSGARAAADSRAQAFMFDEDDDPDGMGSYDILWNDETWKEAIPYDLAEKEVKRILQIIEDSALQAHDNNDHLRVKKIEDGDSMEWTVLDPSDGDYQVVRVQPSDMPAGYTGESIELGSIVESVLEEYPGQPKDYDEGDYDPDEADQREMADDMNNDYEQDEIDPDYEDSELGLRFD